MLGILALWWELLLVLRVPAMLLRREATMRRALVATLWRALITALWRALVHALLEMRWRRSSEGLALRWWEALLLTEALITVRHEG